MQVLQGNSHGDEERTEQRRGEREKKVTRKGTESER